MARVRGPRLGFALLWVGGLLAAPPWHAEAQDSLVLRPEPELGSLADRVARVLRRRGTPTSVGEPPPPLPEAVVAGQVALGRRGEVFSVLLGGREGRTHRATLTLDPSDPGAPRALGLAIETLQDRARRTTPPRASTSAPGHVGAPRLLGDGRGRTLGEPSARPTVYLRLLAGWSPARREPLLGPGAGLGLCVGAHCVVVEAELPVLPEERRLETGETLRYRAVTTSVRGQFRPFVWRWASLGLTFGLLSRVGSASVVGGELRQTVTSLGVRSGVELAWRIVGPLEWVVEAGADVMLASSRARAHVHGQHVFLEDRWAPWVVASLRVRPSPAGEAASR